jgi:hypothetical protein
LAVTSPSLEVQNETGVRWLLDADTPSTGFIEGGRYVFACTENLRLVIDDIDLPRVAEGFHWSPGFYAGQVNAELLGSDGGCVAHYQLDVSPTPDKLGRDLFEAMLRDLATSAPDLLLGSEAHQALFNPGELPAPSEVQYVRLRRYALECCSALQRICERPLTRLVRERRRTAIHKIRRLDVRTALMAARSPVGTVVTNRTDTGKYATGLLDAPVIEDTLDNEANQALAWTLLRLQHRTAQLIDWLVAEGTRQDETFEAKRARRGEILHLLQSRLRQLTKREPFRSVTRRATSSAGLTAIAAHPTYARAQRLAWLALQEGIEARDAKEPLPISPTWQVYERWCYLCTISVMRKLFPDVEWQQAQWGRFPDQLRFHGKHGHFEFAVWLQPRFASWDQTSRWQRNSLSGERFPDIVVTLEGPGGFAFMVLDAKYRSTRTNVLDAMTSAHLYHDSLTWNGIRPWRVLLLVPRADRVSWLAEPAFHEAYGVGAITLSQRDRVAQLHQTIAAFIMANGGPKGL